MDRRALPHSKVYHFGSVAYCLAAFLLRTVGNALFDVCSRHEYIPDNKGPAPGSSCRALLELAGVVAQGPAIHVEGGCLPCIRLPITLIVYLHSSPCGGRFAIDPILCGLRCLKLVRYVPVT